MRTPPPHGGDSLAISLARICNNIWIDKVKKSKEIGKMKYNSITKKRNIRRCNNGRLCGGEFHCMHTRTSDGHSHIERQLHPQQAIDSDHA